MLLSLGLVGIILLIPFLLYSVDIVFADHGSQDASQYFWTRNPSHGHQDEIVCNVNNQLKCKIPYYIQVEGDSRISNIPGSMTDSEINQQLQKSLTVINGMSEYIQFIESPKTNIQDNVIKSESFDNRFSLAGATVFQHCNLLIGNRCLLPVDNHADRFNIVINSNFASNFGTDQLGVCRESVPTDPDATYDLEKTFNHELYHSLGFDHSDEARSIVREGYHCNENYGFAPTAHDILAVEQKYPESLIPSWIKYVAEVWSTDQIQDIRFINAIKWLTQEGIILLDNTNQGYSNDPNIPSWVKNTAGWWSQGLVDDTTFGNSLAYLINEGIIILSISGNSMGLTMYVQGDVTVTPTWNSNVPDCEPVCYDPNSIVIDTRTTVTFSNTDDANHTFTSGTAFTAPTGIFDSGIVMSGDKFSHTFVETGTYDYYCMVHPWAHGVIVVK
jgi:plastocyanin